MAKPDAIQPIAADRATGVGSAVVTLTATQSQRIRRYITDVACSFSAASAAGRLSMPGDLVEKVGNPGFETAGGGGADIWGTWLETAGDGALADEATLFHGGAHAAKVTAGPSANTLVATPAMAVTPGDRLIFAFWTRGDGSNQGRSSLLDVSNGKLLLPLVGTGVPGTTYALVPRPFVVPDGCTQVQGNLYCSTVNTGVAYFDDVSALEEILFQLDIPVGGPTQIKFRLPRLYAGNQVFSLTGGGGNTCKLEVGHYDLAVA